MSKKLHWTQTPEGKARMSESQKKVWADKKAGKRVSFREIAKNAVKGKRAYNKKEPKKPTSLVVNGWRITLTKDEVRIDRE
jgi:hypothetical protein